MKNKSMRVKKIAAWMLVMILACSIGKPVNVKAASKSFTSSEVANYFMSRVGERYPSGYCLKFVSDTFANMGAARSSTCCAFNYGNSHITSTNRDNIPIGADVFFGSCGGGPCDTCKSSYYGHIGVYVGNGYFVHATGGTVQKTSLTGTSWNNKYRGWGYHSNITVSQTSVDNDTHNSDREPFRFSVDQAPVHGTVFHSPGERFSMAGWTLTTYGRGEGVTCVNLIINGKDVVNCSRNQRDDVANVFPDYPNKNAGFYCDVSADLLNPGPNKIALRAYATNLNHNDILIGDFGERTVYYEPAACSLEGCIDLAWGQKGAVVVSGWAFDKNSDAPVDLHIYIGGEAGEPGVPGYAIRADKKREDVAEICKTGVNHGFSDTIYTDCVGEKTLYFYVVNGVSNKFIGTKTVNIQANRAPVGCIDFAEAEPDIIKCGGWCYDPDHTGTPVWIHIYLDAPAGSGKFIGSICADQERKDVAKAENISDSRHGFSGEIEVANLTGPHTLYFYGIDPEGGNNPLLGTKTINLKHGNAPIGVVDWITGKNGFIDAGGWGVDWDNPSGTLNLHMYVGGPAGTPGVPMYEIKADKKRSDVGLSVGAGDFHGFEEKITTSQRGETEVYIYAIDMGSRQPNVLLGHKKVTIKESEEEKAHIHEYTETIIKEATCTEQGNKQYSCNICGDCFTEFIDKIPHTVVTDKAKPAICEENGLTEGSHCSKCKTILEAQEIIEKSGHKNTTVKFQKDATCVCAGYTGDIYCQDCGIKIREGSYTKQLEHTYSEDQAAVLKKPTESEAGINIFTCSVCKTIGFNILPALGFKENENHMHTYVEEIIKVPAYYAKAAEQERVQACACGEYVIENIPAENLWGTQVDASKEPSLEDDTGITEDTESSDMEQDNSENQNSAKKEPENKSKKTVPQTDKVYKSGSYQYRVTKFTADGGTVELETPVEKTVTSVYVPAEVMIDGYAFQVTGIGKNAFKNNKNIKKVIIGVNVTKIGANAFRGCSRLKKIIVKSEKLEMIEKNAFRGVHAKAVISVSKKNKKIYAKLFKGKGQKKTVKIK